MPAERKIKHLECPCCRAPEIFPGYYTNAEAQVKLSDDDGQPVKVGRCSKCGCKVRFERLVDDTWTQARLQHCDK